MVAPYCIVFCSCSLGFQFVHLNHLLSNSIFLIPLNSWVPRLFAISIRIIWYESLVGWKMVTYLHISIVWILNLIKNFFWLFYAFLSHKSQKIQKIVSFYSCVSFKFCCHCFCLWFHFIVFFKFSVYVSCYLFSVFNLSFFLK